VFFAKNKCVQIACCCGLAAALLPTVVTAESVPGVSISGFDHVVHVHVLPVDEHGDPEYGAGTAASWLPDEGEIGVVTAWHGATVRLDVDMLLDTVSAGNDAVIEQAFVTLPVGTARLLGGVFNNPLGYEVEDEADLDFASHNVIYDILNHQTTLRGNNVPGMALAGTVAGTSLTVALLDNSGLSSGAGSLVLVAGFSAAAALDIELGVLTRGGASADSIGDVADINISWSNEQLSAGFDYAAFARMLDSAVVLWAGTAVGNLDIKLRYETVAGVEGGRPVRQFTLYGVYPVSLRNAVTLELRHGELAASGLQDMLANAVEGYQLSLEFVGTF